MKIVVDSNIVFSAILNTKSKIGQLILNGSKYFQFYSVALLKAEIINHKQKIISISNFNENQFHEIFQLIVYKITFINDVLISDKDLKQAMQLVGNIDADDVLFVALSNHLQSPMWMGDKQLIKGLKKKGFMRTISTEELYEIYIEKEMKNKHL